MSRKGKEGMVNGPIPISLRNKPNKQPVIGRRSDDQLVIITGKAAVRIPLVSNEIPRGSQLDLVCWSLLLTLLCWNVVDVDGMICLLSEQQTTTFSVESCA